MCSLEGTIEKNHIEVERDKLCRGQVVRTLKEKHRTTEENRGQKEILIQQMLIGEKEKIEHTIYVENRAIWPKTISRERKEKKEQQKCHKSQQKTIENSELSAGLLKYVQYIVPRKAGK